MQRYNYHSDLSYPFLSEGDKGAGFIYEGAYQVGKTSLKNFRLAYLKVGRVQKVSPFWKLEYGLGISQLHESGTSLNQVAVPFWLLTEQLFGKNEAIWTQLKFSSGFTLDSMAWSANNDVFFRADQAALNASWRFSDRWRWNLRSYAARLSDANVKTSLYSALLYGFETSSPWVWLGWNIDIEHFTENATSYWSPNVMKGTGPIFEGNWELNEMWSLNTELHLNLQKEDSYDWATGFVTALGIQKGKRDKAHLNLNYLFIRSNQKSGYWQSHLVNVVYTF